MNANNNSKGIVLIIIAMSLFAMQDSLIKFILQLYQKKIIYNMILFFKPTTLSMMTAILD